MKNYESDFNDSFGFAGTLKEATKYVPRCYESHPPLSVGEGLFVYGGSCCSPSVKDADVYIGFDYGMQRDEVFPWHQKESGPIEVFFKISDGTAPPNPKEFRNLIVWSAEQIRAGKKVHAGCIGGHGRTGTYLAALVKHMLDIDDATTYVRKHYCKKAVESDSQVNFLHKHWGITKTEGSKSHLDLSGSHKSWKNTLHSGGTGSHGVGKSLMPENTKTFSASSAKSLKCVASKKSIWGR